MKKVEGEVTSMHILKPNCRDLGKKNQSKTQTELNQGPTKWSTQGKVCCFLVCGWLPWFSVPSVFNPFFTHQNKYLDFVHGFCWSAVAAAHLNSSCNSENHQKLFFNPPRIFCFIMIRSMPTLLIFFPPFPHFFFQFITNIHSSYVNLLGSLYLAAAVFLPSDNQHRLPLL